MTVRHAALLALALLPGVAARAAPQPEAPAAPAPEEARPAERRAASVKLLLPEHEDVPALQALVALERGAVVTVAAVRRTVTRLAQSGRCRDVVVTERASAPPAGQGGRWVDLEVACLPPRILAAVSFELDGPGPLTEKELKSELQLTLGDPIDEDEAARIAARARSVLRRHGYLAAAVSGRLVGEPASTLRLRVTAGQPTRVKAVRLPGAGADEPGLLARLATRPGEVLLEERLRSDLDTLVAALHATGHRRGRVGTPALRDVEGGVEVEIPVAPGPLVRLEILGAQAFPVAGLEAQLQLGGAAPLDAAAVDAGVERLRAFYRAHGYALARVEAEERRAGELLVVTIHVAEGRAYRLRQLRVEGAEARGEAGVRARLVALIEEEQGPPPDSQPADWARALEASIPTAGPRPAPPALPAPDTVLDEAVTGRALQRLIDDYQNDGFLEAALLGWSIEADAGQGALDVVVRLREGEQTSVESIGFEGNAQVPLTDLAREARLAPGQPLAFDRVEATRSALQRLYLARGFLYARVEAKEEIDRERHVAALRFVVDEGPRVRIGRVLISGNRQTLASVIRRAISVKEGEPYDPEAVARTQAALLGLGVFRSVGLRLSDAETPEAVKDLNVELAERPWLYVAVGAGFSIANGPRASGEWGQPNLLGRALELTARAKVNYPLEVQPSTVSAAGLRDRWEGRADVGLRAPQLTALPLAAHLDLIAERFRRPAYDMSDISGVLGVDHRLTSRITTSLQYELMVGTLARVGDTSDPALALTQADLERLRFDIGTTSLQAVRASATFDYRDNAAHPHSGWFATGSTEWAHSVGTSGQRYLGFFPGSDIHSNLVKVQGTVSAYLPMSRGTTLALSARGGRVYQLDDTSRTIVPRRFFLGGATTMRGFAEEEMVAQDLRGALADQAHHCASSIAAGGVAGQAGCTAAGARLAGGRMISSNGGDAYILLKGELRIGLSRIVELGLFGDVGNLWSDPSSYRLLDLRPNAGAGLRFVTPVGPAALDVGFNLMPDTRINERVWALHFTIGLF